MASKPLYENNNRASGWAGRRFDRYWRRKRREDVGRGAGSDSAGSDCLRKSREMGIKMSVTRSVEIEVKLKDWAK